MDTTGRQICEWMMGHEREMVDFLGKIVNMDTFTFNREGVEALARLMASELAAIGFKVEFHDPESPREDWVNQAYLEGRGSSGVAQNVLGRLFNGSGRGHLLFVGHIDTAFPEGETARNPFHIVGRRAYGPAVADMKGGVVGVLFGCRALIELGLARPETITVVYNSDEQAGTICSRNLIQKEARRADWGLVTEAGRPGGEVVGQRAGLAMGKIEVEGVEAHLGTGYREGRSAIEVICRKVIALHRLHNPEGGILLNIGEIHGGVRRNLYARHAEAFMDVRVADSKKWESINKLINEIIRHEEIPGTTSKIYLWQHRPPMPWTENTHRIAAVLRESGKELGCSIEIISTMGGSDANIIAAEGKPTLCGLGPIGGQIMTPNEYIELPSLVERTSLVAILSHKLSLQEGAQPIGRTNVGGFKKGVR
jgi:glutamate carboxypeptidase